MRVFAAFYLATRKIEIMWKHLVLSFNEHEQSIAFDLNGALVPKRGVKTLKSIVFSTETEFF